MSLRIRSGHTNVNNGRRWQRRTKWRINKNAEALENMNKVNVLITDKTGTITEGKPSVENIISFDNADTDKLLRFAASLNQYSEHPLATAVVNFAKSKNITVIPVTNFEAIMGKGVIGTIENIKIAVGNKKLMEDEQVVITDKIASQITQEQIKGKRFLSLQ